MKREEILSVIDMFRDHWQSPLELHPLSLLEKVIVKF